MKRIIEVKQLWDYFSYCCWGGTITRAQEALRKIETYPKIIQIIGAII